MVDDFVFFSLPIFNLYTSFSHCQCMCLCACEWRTERECSREGAKGVPIPKVVSTFCFAHLVGGYCCVFTVAIFRKLSFYFFSFSIFLFWSFQYVTQVLNTKTLYSDIGKVFIFSIWVVACASFGDLSMLHFGLDFVFSGGVD